MSMSEEEHVFYFSSKFTKQDKVSGSFTVNLPFTLNLKGKWKCAILNFFIKPDISNDQSSQYIYILADFCKTSFVQGNKERPILQKIGLSKSNQQYNISNLLYISVKQSTLSDFDLLFLDSSFNPIILGKRHIIECALHFMKYE